MAEGHELASHGWNHTRADRQTQEAFRADVRRTRAVLEDIAGVRVSGYRAATFSIGAGNLWAFPILLEFDKGFKSAMQEWCSTCKVTENPQQASDIGTNTPGKVVSAMQQAPDTDWLVFDLAELETGVDSALAGAGITGTHIGGLSALPANYEALKNKTQTAWTSYPLPVVGYRQIDSFARKFNGDPIVSAQLPTQLATADNVNNLVFDDKGNYIGVKDYQAQFRKLWQVGS